MEPDECEQGGERKRCNKGGEAGMSFGDLGDRQDKEGRYGNFYYVVDHSADL